MHIYYCAYFLKMDIAGLSCHNLVDAVCCSTADWVWDCGLGPVLGLCLACHADADMSDLISLYSDKVVIGISSGMLGNGERGFLGGRVLGRGNFGDVMDPMSLVIPIVIDLQYNQPTTTSIQLEMRLLASRSNVTKFSSWVLLLWHVMILYTLQQMDTQCHITLNHAPIVNHLEMQLFPMMNKIQLTRST